MSIGELVGEPTCTKESFDSFVGFVINRNTNHCHGLTALQTIGEPVGKPTCTKESFEGFASFVIGDDEIFSPSFPSFSYRIQ